MPPIELTTLLISSIFTISLHPVGAARNDNPLPIIGRGTPSRPAPPASIAPFFIQPNARWPSAVNVPSEFTSVSHDE